MGKERASGTRLTVDLGSREFYNAVNIMALLRDESLRSTIIAALVAEVRSFSQALPPENLYRPIFDAALSPVQDASSERPNREYGTSRPDSLPED